MAFQDLLPWVEADAQRDQQRSEQWRDARRTQTIGTYMATANQIRRQLGYVDNLHKALALVTDPNTHKPVAGHEEEATRLQRQLGEYNVDALHGNLNQVETYIQRLYDPNFNAETGMPGRSPIRALGEKLHLAKPQVSPLMQPQAAGVDPTQFETKLTPEEEQQFQQWKQKYAPNDSGYDYDLRGAFKAGLTPDPQSGHFPDTFKKPNHPTFSNQSMYASQRPDLAGTWQGDQYVRPQPQRKTAGELIRGLRAIQQKYDIAAPGIETGEQELASEAAQREKEQGLERDIEFAQREGKKVGASEEEIRGIALSKLGGYKPTAPKTQFDVMQGTVDGQPVTWQRNKYTGEVQTLTGDPVPDEQLNKFQAAPKGGKGAAKPRHAWSKDKNGRIFSVLLDPATNQIVPNSENYTEQPPASLVGRISTGQYHFVDTEGNVHEIRETRTSMPASGAGGGPAPRGGAGAGAGTAAGDKIIGHKDTPVSTAAKKIADLMETDANSANDYMQSRRAGQKSSTSDSALVISWVRAQVRGAGRLTNTEIEFGLRSGSYETRFSNAWNQALSGTLNDGFVENMVTDINRGAKAARETADKYKIAAGSQGQEQKKRVSLTKAMALPQNRGKSADEVRQDLKKHNYDVKEDLK